jgi:predicted phosphodiesterase
VIACLYDVHGNLPALDGVLADARAQGVEEYLLGGDYCLFGGWPAETRARLRGLERATWIRGNVDRWLSDAPDAPNDEVHGAIADCRAALGERAVAELHALPERARLADGSLAVHASPVSVLRYFFPEPAPDEAELLDGVSAPRLIFGHTHLAFRRTVGGMELLNPGSVGMPLDGDHRASYALLHPDGRAEHRRVAYDHAASAQRLREAFGGSPWSATIAGRIERARFDAS